jgi:endonuclease YncB( thermonuclease family)
LDDKQRLAIAGLVFLVAAALFAACLALTAGSAILRPRAAARQTQPTQPATLSPGHGLTTTASAGTSPTSTLTGTLQVSGTPVVTQTLTPPSETPTATLEPTPTPSPTFASLAQDDWCIPWNTTSSEAQVVRVIDGVNIEVNLDGLTVPVRYIGVDLLEFGDDASLWQQMTDKNQELVGGKTVLLIKDRSDVDDSGRLLRYVLADSVFVNLELASSGYAVAASAPPNQSCDAMLLEAQEQAVVAQLGLWAPEPTPTRILLPSPTPTPLITGPMQIGLVVNRGSPWQEPDEFVEVLNDGTEPIQLKGWTLNDEQNHVFTFPSFVLGPGQHCRVYTNLYSPTTCGFSFFRDNPIWDDWEECAYLKDPLGETISIYCYY